MKRKTKILIVIAMILVSMYLSLTPSYAAQATAYASIIIIIPPEDAEPQSQLAEQDTPEENISEEQAAYVKNEKGD